MKETNKIPFTSRYPEKGKKYKYRNFSFRKKEQSIVDFENIVKARRADVKCGKGNKIGYSIP